MLAGAIEKVSIFEEKKKKNNNLLKMVLIKRNIPYSMCKLKSRCFEFMKE